MRSVVDVIGSPPAAGLQGRIRPANASARYGRVATSSRVAPRVASGAGTGGVREAPSAACGHEAVRAPRSAFRLRGYGPDRQSSPRRALTSLRARRLISAFRAAARLGMNELCSKSAGDRRLEQLLILHGDTSPQTKQCSSVPREKKRNECQVFPPERYRDSPNALALANLAMRSSVNCRGTRPQRVFLPQPGAVRTQPAPR